MTHVYIRKQVHNIIDEKKQFIQHTHTHTHVHIQQTYNLEIMKK